MNTFQALFEASMKENKGLFFYVSGNVIGGVVTNIGDGVITLKNRDYSVIILSVSQILAVAMP